MQNKALVIVIGVLAGCAQVGPASQPPVSVPLVAPAQAVSPPTEAAELAATTEIPHAAPALELESAVELTSVPDPADVDDGPGSVWTRIEAGFALPPMDNGYVREWEEWYSSRPEYVTRMIDRSSHFLYYVAQEVDSRGMPMEIALLPMIESAYNPMANSTSQAAGMWQFISTTAKHYGLRQNWWYDGRRDVIEATDAALDYLEKLYADFGDWQLALAAYNCGEGAVSRAIARNRAKGLPADYESLDLPQETREYVPKLMAVRDIVADPARFGLAIEDIPDEPYFEIVPVSEHMDVKLAASLAELELDEFKLLNPAHKKPVIKAGKAARIVLPVGKAAVFRANIRKHRQPLLSWKIVRLRRGQRAQTVAVRHGMTLAELKRVSGVAGRRRIVVGQPLLVRVRGGIEDAELPDLPVVPVTLGRAFRAAKHTRATKHHGRAVSRAKFAPHAKHKAKRRALVKQRKHTVRRKPRRH
jgi:membrane-bound lytic murein transglycosylase D